MLDKLNHLYPVRYTALGVCVVAALLSLFTLIAFGKGLLALLVFGGLSVVGVRDLRQSLQAPLRKRKTGYLGQRPLTDQAVRWIETASMGWQSSAQTASPHRSPLAKSTPAPPPMRQSR